MRSSKAFTLIELSIVIIVLALVAITGLRYATLQTDIDKNAELTATLDVIEQTLANYRTAYNRLPCPADLTLAENTALFGTEVGTPGDGACTGYNFINSSTDPDTTGGTNPGAPDALYDSAAASKIVAGGVPVKALNLPDKYAYDPWGRKLMYVVDIRITETGAFFNYALNPTGGPFAAGTVGGIVVKAASTDALTSAYTYKAIYALVAFGKDGHGAYLRNTSATSTRVSRGITNTGQPGKNTWLNCHCNASAVATNFDRTFVQTSAVQDISTFTNSFDDTVRFKTRVQMPLYSEVNYP